MRRLRSLALIASLLMASGCAQMATPHRDDDRAAESAERSLTMPDGARLLMRVWLPAETPKAALIALHGFNDYSNAWTAQAKIWAESGIATYAIDQRGFGENEDRGEWAGAVRMAADARAAVRMAAAAHPGAPVYLLGESMGAAVSIAATTSLWREAAPLPLAGMILSAPAVRARRTMNWLYRGTLWLGSTLLPGVTVHPPRGVSIQPSDNIPMLRALGADPLVIKGAKIGTLSGLVDLMDVAMEESAHLRGRVLILYGANDQVIAKEPTCRMLARLPAAGAPGDGAEDHRIVLYPKGWHMLTRDLAGRLVIEDIAAWVLQPDAPPPSGFAAGPAEIEKFCQD
jgi:alpha-beta hydrolase superfamily lysophospholipase